MAQKARMATWQKAKVLYGSVTNEWYPSQFVIRFLSILTLALELS
jgi:hypothetical protein